MGRRGAQNAQVPKGGARRPWWAGPSHAPRAPGTSQPGPNTHKTMLQSPGACCRAPRRVGRPEVTLFGTKGGTRSHRRGRPRRLRASFVAKLGPAGSLQHQLPDHLEPARSNSKAHAAAPGRPARCQSGRLDCAHGGGLGRQPTPSLQAPSAQPATRLVGACPGASGAQTDHSGARRHLEPPGRRTTAQAQGARPPRYLATLTSIATLVLSRHRAIPQNRTSACQTRAGTQIPSVLRRPVATLEKCLGACAPPERALRAGQWVTHLQTQDTDAP